MEVVRKIPMEFVPEPDRDAWKTACAVLAHQAAAGCNRHIPAGSLVVCYDGSSFRTEREESWSETGRAPLPREEVEEAEEAIRGLLAKWGWKLGFAYPVTAMVLFDAEGQEVPRQWQLELWRRQGLSVPPPAVRKAEDIPSP